MKTTEEKSALARLWAKENPERHRANCRRWRKEHSEKVKKWNNPGRQKEYAYDYYKKNPEKYHAHNALNNAIKSGRVLRPDTCPCGNPNPQGHHEDYSKPLMVMWLCLDCHKKLHRKDRNEQH